VGPGLLLAALLAGIALGAAQIPFVRDSLHIGALLLVILLGMGLKSVVRLPASVEPGLKLAKGELLRLGVAGLGFKLSLGELGQIGPAAVAVVVVCTFAAYRFGLWLARAMGLDARLGALLSVGGAVCGASAIAAADSVVQSEKSDVAISLGTITLLGTIGIVFYPVVARATGMDPFLYGVWNGASLHEMAQVVAAGQPMGERALEVSTVVKLARIALLAPIILLLAHSFRGQGGEARVAAVPWFLALFLVFAVVNSLGVLPETVVEAILLVDLVLLCVGMAGVGLQAGFGDLRRAGARPLIFGLVHWLALAVLSLGLAWLLLRQTF
jgi:uncharacterized integral membrane protein (TIGR00698 family)